MSQEKTSSAPIEVSEHTQEETMPDEPDDEFFEAFKKFLTGGPDPDKVVAAVMQCGPTKIAHKIIASPYGDDYAALLITAFTDKLAAEYLARHLFDAKPSYAARVHRRLGELKAEPPSDDCC